MYWVYSVLLLMALLLSAPWWFWQMLRHGKYLAGWSERLGGVPKRLQERVGGETIWIHAVSVGEVLAVTQLIAELQQRLACWRIVVSTTTDTGQKLAVERFGEENVFRAPLDLPWAVQAFIDALRPRMLVLVESEFWPNLLHAARTAGVTVAVVNARVSDRSLPRYSRFHNLFARVLSNVDLFLGQTEEDMRRLIAIGAAPERTQVGGNLKFEVKPSVRTDTVVLIASAIKRDKLGPVIVAGSTLEGEEAMLLEAFRTVRDRYPSAMLLVAPRHPERFDPVGAFLASSEITYERRSRWNGESLLAGGVLLLDTVGELASLYEFADIAFIGGSLVPRGGHNVLEPAHFAVPILVGPHTENFRDIIDTFVRANGLRIVTPQTLTATILELLASDSERQKMGRNAQDTMREQQGATPRTVDALLALLAAHPADRSALVEATAERRA